MNILSIILQTSIRDHTFGEYIIVGLIAVMLYMLKRYWNKGDKNEDKDKEHNGKHF